MTTIRRTSLDVSAPETFDRWCETPDYDARTLEEFAAEGGYPVGPPNTTCAEGTLPPVPAPVTHFGPAWNRQPLPPVYPGDEDS